MDLFRLLLLACALASLIGVLGCSMPGAATGEEESFEGIARKIRRKGDPIVFQGDGRSRVLVSPHLQGRILTLRVGTVESTGLVNLDAIEKGEVDPHFNNFGGVDRFWIYPLPISRVRSRIDMIIVLAMPKLATSSEMPPSRPSAELRMRKTVRISWS